MRPDGPRGVWSAVARGIIASAAVVALTGVCHRLGFDITTTALLDLIAIVLWSLSGSFAVAAIASIAATLSLNYFLVARAFSFPERWLDLAALGAFLITALVITRLLSRVRESLREAQRSEAYLAEAQRLSHTGSWAINVRHPDKHYTSPEVARILGLDPAAGALSERSLQERVHPEDLPGLREKMTAALRDKADFDLELRIVRPDASVRRVYLVGHPVLERSGQVLELVGTLMDITERRRAERAIRRARERALHARFDAVLDERTRLAREIHDTLLQGFTGVALKLVAAVNRFGGSPEATSALQDVINLAQKTLVDARRAVWDLRNPSPAGEDLTTGLRTLAEGSLRGTGVSLEFDWSGSPRPVDPDIQAAVGRVVQEALTNVVKHAAARTVHLRLAYQARGLRLSVSDDGRGFSADPGFQSYGGHWGLLGMRERVAQIRGRLRVRSTSGEGTEVVLLVPYRS